MSVQVKLYSTLRLKRQDYDSKNGIMIHVEDSIDLQSLLNLLDIDVRELGMLSVNDRIIQDMEYNIKNGDIVKLFSHLPTGG